MSKNILKERKMLDWQDPSFKLTQPKKSQVNTEAHNSRVLVTSKSTLVDLISFSRGAEEYLLSIDSENLLRFWDLAKNANYQSYRINFDNRVTAIALDDSKKFLASGSSSGEAKILNLMSGGTLYDLPKCDTEITCLKFIESMSEYWLLGGCWEGKVMMWARPTRENNFTVQARCKIGHGGDILALDCMPANFLVTGSADGNLGVWNVFSGQLKYTVKLPRSKETNFH